MDSPDGTITLTMEKQQQSGLPTKYFFYTIGLQSDQKTIFNKEVDDTENLSIPYNAWSPDNKYVFLKESTPTINNYYVPCGNLFRINNSIMFNNTNTSSIYI